MAPQIKHPPFIDISHWIEVEDFTLLDPQPWVIGTKATQSTYYLDATYATYCDEIRAIGARLLSYHFMDTSDPIEQANWFSEIVMTAGLKQHELLACDIEVPGITLNAVKAFLDRVQVLTGVRPIVYSREIMLEEMYGGVTPPNWLKGEWFWIAEYPTNPDLTNEIPDWIVPAGISKDRIAAWQYTDDGIYIGIPGNNVDLNLLGPTYIEAINLTSPVPGEEPMPDNTLYYADLKPNLTSNVRQSPGLDGNVITYITGPQTVAIISQKVMKDNYDWYQIATPIFGWIALTSSYTNFRPAMTTDDPPVKVTIETLSGKIYVSTDFSEQV